MKAGARVDEITNVWPRIFQKWFDLDKQAYFFLPLVSVHGHVSERRRPQSGLLEAFFVRTLLIPLGASVCVSKMEEALTEGQVG